MLRLLKKLVPKSLTRHYHHLLAIVASWVYGRPSRHLIVVGVTGTDGKTTTASMIADVLAATGESVGLSTSAVFQIGSKRWLNDSHMTMPGRFRLQKMLRQMVQAGCHYAVIEVSSEGTIQYRHSAIDFDVAVITNLTPEHIEAHGSFEAYRDAKGMLFRSIIRGGDKHLFGQTIPKVTVVNLDDANHDYFLSFWAEAHYGTSLKPHDHLHAVDEGKMTVLTPSRVRLEAQRSVMTLKGHELTVSQPGEYNVRNALQAAAVGRSLGLEWSTIASGLSKLQSVPGRGESIDSGKGWRVVIDYALTPHALASLYQSLKQQGAKRIIAVFGAAGGGRDAWKRPELGKIAAAYCDYIILTTDDPYRDDPAKIANDILSGIPESSRANVETILDRKQAISKAMSLAQAGDIIAVTGMGSETSMMVKGKRVEWSDGEAVKHVLAGL